MKDVPMISSPIQHGIFFTLPTLTFRLPSHLHRACIHEHYTAFGIRQYPSITFIRLFFLVRKSFHPLPSGNTALQKGQRMAFWVLIPVWVLQLLRLDFLLPSQDRARLIANSICRSLNCDSVAELRFLVGIFLSSFEDFFPMATRSGSSDFLLVCFFCY